MKFDNGKPFGDTTKQSVSLITLWLVGLGIKVIFNRPRVPQDNAKVERCQGVTQKWSEFKRCSSYEMLQKRLDQAVLIQREQYPVVRLGGKTRLQAFPQLDSELNRQVRPYCAMNFDIDRVYSYLVGHVWQRKVTTNGQIGFWGQRYLVNKKLAGQIIDFKIDTADKSWKAFDIKGNLVLTIPSPFTVQKLCHITIISNNFLDDYC